MWLPLGIASAVRLITRRSQGLGPLGTAHLMSDVGHLTQCERQYLPYLPHMLCTHHVWFCTGPKGPITRSLHVSYRHRVRRCLSRNNSG